jgi:hypothetical protein
MCGWFEPRVDRASGVAQHARVQPNPGENMKTERARYPGTPGSDEEAALASLVVALHACVARARESLAEGLDEANAALSELAAARCRHGVISSTQRLLND